MIQLSKGLFQAFSKPPIYGFRICGIYVSICFENSRKLSTKYFNFSCFVVASLSFSFKGGMLVVSFVRCLHILHVSCKLLVSRFWRVWFHLLPSWVLMALFISSFEAFMQGCRARLCVLCHKVPSFLRSLIRGCVKIAFSVDQNFDSKG